MIDLSTTLNAEQVCGIRNSVKSVAMHPEIQCFCHFGMGAGATAVRNIVKLAQPSK